MNPELLTLALIVGACTWAFRYLPLTLDLSSLRAEAPLGRFLSATGPAAIATLFVASILPMLDPASGRPVPLVAGVGAVLAVFLWRRSAVAATLAGAVAYGAVFALA